MDLYRILRVSIYLTVASGAFALSVAEQNMAYLFAVLCFGGLAYATVDSGRIKPVRMEYTAAMTLALLVYTLLPAQEGVFLQGFPTAAAHFLCAFQVLLFFTAYRGSVLLTFCGSTLLVVVVSGIMQPGVSLAVRMACYVGLTAWTLFIHSLWRSRENYNHSSPVAIGNAAPEADRTLSERAFWQGLNLTLGLSLACLLLGAAFFFLMPRINETLAAFVDTWILRRAPDHARGGGEGGGGTGSADGADGVEGGLGRGSPDLISVKRGWSEGMEYRIRGDIAPDGSTAFSVFAQSARDFASRDHRVYLRGQALSEHAKSGRWVYAQPTAREAQIPARQGSVEIPPDPSTKIQSKGKPLKLIIHQKAAFARVFFSMGTPTRVTARDMKGLWQDAEGALWKPDAQIVRYEVSAIPPLFPEALPAGASAEHEDYRRYVAETGLNPRDEEQLKLLAGSIVQKARATTALEKIHAILDFLKDPNRFQYTLKGENLNIRQFLMEEGKHRGQCGYFATAFVLLCRLNYIPARLATGFCATLRDRQLRPGDYAIQFQNSDSHAWAEVYFKGFGWVIFDPTPSGNAPEVAAVPEAVHSAETTLTAPASLETANPRRGALARAWDAVLNFDGRQQRRMYERFSSAIGGGLDSAGGILAGRSFGGWLAAALAWVLVGTMLYFLLAVFLKRGRRRGAYAHGGSARARAAVAFYNDLLHVLSRRGFVRRPGQTPREFADFVVRRGGDAFRPVLVVTQVFEQVRYGGGDVNQEEFNALQSALDNLRELAFVFPASAARN